jgi:hypothetical protein
LAPRAFLIFGDTRGAIYDAGEDPVRNNWSAVVVSVSRSMQVGMPTQFKSRHVDQDTQAVASATNMWDKGHRVEADTYNKGEEAHESVTNLSFNLELPHEAVVDVDLPVKN